MGTAVSFNPTSIDLGVIPPGEVAEEQVWSDTLTAAANVTATIVNDTSGGAFKVAAITKFLPVKQFVDPGELGPGPQRPRKPIATTVYEPVGQTDGTTPLSVTGGQVVAVLVQFTGQANSNNDARTATLQIRGDSWNQISIPLKALTGQISINIPTILLIQNGSISMPFVVTSVAGPPTVVDLSTAPMSSLPPGISFSVIFLPNQQVSKGHPASGVLKINAAIQSKPGTYQLDIYSSAFDGATNTFTFSLNVKAIALRPSPINAKYLTMQARLGLPTADEAFCFDYVGQYRSYKNGAIFWSGVQGAAAFEVDGPILGEWLNVGVGYPPEDLYAVPNHSLGYPISDVLPAVSLDVQTIEIGQVCHFEHCAIYWKANLGTHIVAGQIFDKYAKLGETAGILGFPITSGTGDSTYDFVDFENGGLFITQPDCAYQKVRRH